jgi:hypothetical protein
MVGLRRLDMKRWISILLLAAVSPFAAYSIPDLPATSISAVPWRDARSMGMGGASLLFSQGYDSFFGNPAGFAQKASLTLGDLSFWGYTPIAPASLQKLQNVLNLVYTDPAEKDAVIDELLATNGVLGGGFSAGLGWAGGGFGLGFSMVSDLGITGADFANSSLVSRNQLTAVIGLGLPIKLGILRLDLGADVRGFYRLDTHPTQGWAAYDLVNAALGYGGDFEALIQPNSMLTGMGYAFDAGVTLKIGPISAGLMARDLFAFYTADIRNMAYLQESSFLPEESYTAVALNPTFTAGLAVRLNESGLVSPSIYAQTSDIEGFIQTAQTMGDIDALLRTMQIGAELRLIRILLMRLGINENLFSLGFGIDLALVRADVAVFLLPSDGLVSGGAGMTARMAVKF